MKHMKYKSRGFLFLLFVLQIFFSSKISAQQFLVGNKGFTFTDSLRQNRSIACEVYYPADTAGVNVPLTLQSAGKFPILVFGHGFTMTWDAYSNIWNALVPRGYIMIFPLTEGGFSPSHSEFARDIAFLINSMRQLSSDNNSIFYERVDSMNCVMGHSMGGGAAVLSVQYNSEIKSLLLLAPAETNPSAIQAAGNINIPALVISGSNDCVTPPAQHQLPIYNSLSSTCKTYVSITGGSHCQMSEYNLLCSIGELSCSPAPAISRQQQHSVIVDYIIPWLNNRLKSDCAAGIQFDSLINSDPRITYLKTCDLCSSTGFKNLYETNRISAFPNPFALEFQIEVMSGDELVRAIHIFDNLGRRIGEEKYIQTTSINRTRVRFLEIPEAGIFFVQVKTAEGVFNLKMIYSPE
ncbi:MAG: T9SS C-terminal target domain-containing protein [Bacteroidetes bacterium]|nr:MAG: T9SS C-terminal target domain-containing protein [Bacteroidota bacterium]REK07564.1 MAG: T9SS C-terminal target domain-containing protein [Bacteroidota bacterium]REK37003.1 MAG: T9SS C-terminal target domain-containing protein [Bacteroidota bacterium]REK47824.1 MAG: T9SS C-terminal target domain-containing protein [Bacteroidota bacterium]